MLTKFTPLAILLTPLSGDSVRERILTAIADPNRAYLLLLTGILGIYAEFLAPGLILPGVLGGILASLGVFALTTHPIHASGATLLILGYVMLVSESKLKSRGALAIAGTVAMLLGALHLIDSPAAQIRLSSALSSTIPFALITVYLTSIAAKARTNKSTREPRRHPSERYPRHQKPQAHDHHR